MITKKKLLGYFLFIFVVVVLPPALDRGASYYIKRTKYAPLIFTKYDPEDTARKVYERYYRETPNERVSEKGYISTTDDYGLTIGDFRKFFTSDQYLKDDQEHSRQETGGYFDYYGLKTLLGFYDRCYLRVYFEAYIFSGSNAECYLQNFFTGNIKEVGDVF